MGWMESIGEAVSYIEENIAKVISISEIAKQVYLSPFYFQKGFSMLCGITVGEYIRQRRLSLAGSELASSDEKIIDIAMKYGYDSPDSFTKAFTRFHGVTPTAVRKDGAMIKSLAPLKIKFTLEGGYTMDYKLVEKDPLKIVGFSRMFDYESSKAEIPQFWTEHYQGGKSGIICGKYGACIDENGMSGEFEYLIADDYNDGGAVPDGCVVKEIPKHTWAIFPCRGAMPTALQDVNQKIFSEWLPNNKDYEIAGNYNIELYTDVADYPNGTQDENYYSEIWIPVKKCR